MRNQVKLLDALRAQRAQLIERVNIAALVADTPREQLVQTIRKVEACHTLTALRKLRKTIKL